MAYPIGAQVRVTTIGKVGRVVAAARGGRYRVLVGNVEIPCREEELEAPAAEGKRRKAPPPAPPPVVSKSHSPRPSEADRSRLGAIDLHGATVEEALRAVEARIDEAILAGLDHLDVIHGIGTGKVRHAVHQLLGGIGSVQHYELMPDNRGVTRVYF